MMYKSRICNHSTAVYQRVQDHAAEYLQQMYPEDDDSTCDVCWLVDQLLTHNLTLAFVGDSLTRQTGVGLECELLRRGYRVTSKKLPHTKLPGCSWRHCIGEKVRFSIQPPNSERLAHFYHYGVYRPGIKDNNTEIKQEVIAHSDIVVFDHGLHWTPNEAKAFKKEMTQYLQAFKDTNLTLVAWRETSAQHFNSSGGHYGIKREGNKCVPLGSNGEVEAEGYRIPLMKDAASMAGLSWVNILDPPPDQAADTRNELVFLPYRNFTAPLYYMHPHDAECTHYCHTPFVWLPIWRNIRLALDRALRHNKIDYRLEE